MIELDGYPGQHINSFCAELVKAAGRHGEARGVFNETEVVADRNATVESLYAQWETKQEEAWIAYRNSPEGKAQIAAHEANVRAAQDLHDRLVHDLATLDFKNDVAVLDWICAIQDSTDHCSVSVNKTAILAAFDAAGFKANVNCGRDFRSEDRDNVFRYIVGQALDGLKSVAIHGIIHKFAGEWKDKFIRTAA